MKEKHMKPAKKTSLFKTIAGILRSDNNDDMPVKIHLQGEGFYVDPREVLDHPKARRQIKQMQNFFKNKTAK